MAKAKAKTKTKPKAKPAAAKKTRKAVREESRGMGDNINAIRKAAEPFIKKLFDLQERMDSDMGGYRAEFADLYEKGANEIGCKVTVLKSEFARAKSRKRELEHEADMDRAERDQIEALRASMENTQFEMFFEGELAPPSKEAKKAADAEAKAAVADANKAADEVQESVH